MVWPYFKVFWSSKDNPTGHSERKKKKRQTEEEVGRLVLGIGQKNHNRLSEELNRLIIDCTIGFLFAVSNNIQRSLKEYQKPEHVCSWLNTDC